MKVKINAGAEFEVLNAGETRAVMDGALQGWLEELRRGVRFRDFAAGVRVDAATTWAITAAAELGPDPGMLWSVTRLAVSGAGFDPTADTYSVWVNEASGMRQVTSGLTRSHEWQVGGLVLHGGDRLILAGTGVVADKDIYLSGAAVEVPVHLAWQLLG